MRSRPVSGVRARSPEEKAGLYRPPERYLLSSRNTNNFVTTPARTHTRNNCPARRVDSAWTRQRQSLAVSGSRTHPCGPHLDSIDPAPAVWPAYRSIQRPRREIPRSSHINARRARGAISPCRQKHSLLERLTTESAIVLVMAVAKHRWRRDRWPRPLLRRRLR
jgi:hypothetical protein